MAWTWGYNDTKGADVVLELSIAQVDPAGRLSATLELADLHDTSCRLTTKFETEYLAIDNLRAWLEAMLTSQAGQAMLVGR